MYAKSNAKSLKQASKGTGTKLASDGHGIWSPSTKIAEYLDQAHINIAVNERDTLKRLYSNAYKLALDLLVSQKWEHQRTKLTSHEKIMNKRAITVNLPAKDNIDAVLLVLPSNTATQYENKLGYSYVNILLHGETMIKHEQQDNSDNKIAYLSDHVHIAEESSKRMIEGSIMSFTTGQAEKYSLTTGNTCSILLLTMSKPESAVDTAN